MQSLSRTIKLPPTVIRKLRTCEDARAQAQDYQQRYLATACRYEASKVQDEFAAVQNSALYNRRVARAMQLLAQWLAHTDPPPALERLQATTWRAMYQELGMAPDASELQQVSIQTSHGVTLHLLLRPRPAGTGASARLGGGPDRRIGTCEMGRRTGRNIAATPSATGRSGP